MKCKVCNELTIFSHEGKILDKYNIKYFRCKQCGFVQTEDPYWLDEAYSEALSISDTGIMVRNSDLSQMANIILSLISNKNGCYLDYGGGYGIFTRIMRDKGFDFYWYDKYAKNMVAKGFERILSNHKYEAVTSFENFEHFENPMEEIEKIFKLTDTVLFSTELIPVKTPAIDEWWYYCTEHGQHISIFSLKSLEFIANKYEYNFITNGKNLHIFSKNKISNNIFLIEKIMRKLKLDIFLTLPSRTINDMNIMISKMSRT